MNTTQSFSSNAAGIPESTPIAVSPIVQKTREYTLEYLQTSRCKFLPFHNAQHTLDVFFHATLIGIHEEIHPDDMEIVQLAALLHDIGNADRFKGHEQISMDVARTYLAREGYHKTKMAVVVDCIQATQLPQTPKNALGKIICDADLFHLGDYSFMSKNRALRNEWAMYLNKTFTDKQWYEQNIEFLENHHYFTKYGKYFLNNGKVKNNCMLRYKLKKIK